MGKKIEVPEQYLPRKKAAEYLGLSQQTLSNWAHQRRGPNYVMFGRAIRYRLSDLEKFAAERTVQMEQRA